MVGRSSLPPMPTGDSVPAFDLVVHGGRVIDPSQSLDGLFDVGVRYGRVAAVGAGLAGRLAMERRDDERPLMIDATGGLVVPGLIDLHTHVYAGVTPFAVSVDEVASRSGVATVVSAGDAGAHTIEGFRRLVVGQSKTRVFAFLNISAIGLAGHPIGEAIDLGYLDVDAAERAVVENADVAVGIKVRETARTIVGSNGLEPLRRAVAVGTAVNVPVMCHIGSPPSPVADVLSLLRPGDLLTHCFTGQQPGLLDGSRLGRAAIEAKANGVLFDLGHGSGSFSYAVAEVAASSGFWPDTISTDLHSLSINGPVFDLPTTMSKMLALGMPVADVIRATTWTPATAIGRSHLIGNLAVGRVADICVLDIEDGDFRFQDSCGDFRSAVTRLRVRHTIRAGRSADGPFPPRAREWPVMD